jgi:predicted phosphodiesterase
MDQALPMPPASAPLLSPDGAVLVFGGPYSNLEATRAMLSVAERIGIPPDNIICTGDVVAYCADPAETVHLVREAGIHVIMGNCEESLAAGADDCGCGFTPGSSCDRLAAAWYAHADRQLEQDARSWMAGLLRRLDIEIAGRRLCVVHGGVTSINRFLFASSPTEEKVEELNAAACDGIIGGHCGLPFTQVIGGRLWHNAGAIGMPANDGSPRAWFSMLAPSDNGIRIEHRALSYDFAAAAEKMRRAGLPEGYANALVTGIWPNSDVLPSKELGETGLPLRAGTVQWCCRAPARSSFSRQLSVQVVHLWPRDAEASQTPTGNRCGINSSSKRPPAE